MPVLICLKSLLLLLLLLLLFEDHLPDSPLGQLVHRAYVEQTSLGWNLVFRGFWTISLRTAQEYEFTHNPLQHGFTDNGASWAG
jgi:hypothetical protein